MLAHSNSTLTSNTASSTPDMAAPQTMKAIKAVVPGKAEVQDVSVPEVRDDWILVKVKYVALNPTDWYD